MLRIVMQLNTQIGRKGLSRHPVGNSRRDFLKSAVVGLGVTSFVSADANAPSVGLCAEAPPGRKARIATVCQGGNFKGTMAENREYIMGLLDLACQNKPDLVCSITTATVSFTPVCGRVSRQLRS